jgi:hypothetical protein
VIAMNGYMLKMAPRENRSMFIAATTALAGVLGGLGSVAGGLFLHQTESFSLLMFGRHWTNYHLLFLLSFFLRLLCIPMALAVREPTSAESVKVINYMMGLWPMRMLMFPVGLYRSASSRVRRNQR